MSFPLFREPEFAPLNPLYTTQFSLFSHATIAPLYELIDITPSYHAAWNTDGTGLYCASNQTLHHVQFTPKTLLASEIPSLTQQYSTMFHLPLSTPTPDTSSQKDKESTSLSQFITTHLVHAANSQIIKIIPSPDNPKRMAIISLDDKVRVIDFHMTPKRTDFKIIQTIQCPAVPSSQQIPIHLQSAHPTLPNSMQTLRVPIDAYFFKQSTQLVVVDNFNNLSYWDLQSPNAPLRVCPLHNNLKMVGMLPPSYSELLHQLYPTAVLNKINPSSADDSGTQAQLGKSNNAAIYSSQKFSPITSIHINNLMDDHIFVTSGHGDVYWCDQKSLTPYVQKRVAMNSSINAAAISTQFLAPHVREMIMEYNQLQQQLRAQTSNSNNKANPGGNRTSHSHSAATPFASKPPLDEKAIQLFNQRTCLHNVLSQLQHDQTISIGTNDGLVYILSAIDFSVLHTIQTHDNPIISLSYSPDGVYLATLSLKTKDIEEVEHGNLSSLSGLLCIIHVETGHTVYQRQNHGITSFAWNPIYPVAAITSLVTLKKNLSHRGVVMSTDFLSQLSILDFSSASLTSNIPNQIHASFSNPVDDLFPTFPPPQPLQPPPPTRHPVVPAINPSSLGRIQTSFGINPTNQSHLGPATTLGALDWGFLTLKLPLSTAWNFEKPYNSTYDFHYYDALASDARSTNRGTHNGTMKTKYEMFARNSSYQNVSANNFSKITNLILNTKSVEDCRGVKKNDRYADIKDNLGDILEGADEIPQEPVKSSSYSTNLGSSTISSSTLSSTLSSSVPSTLSSLTSQRRDIGNVPSRFNEQNTRDRSTGRDIAGDARDTREDSRRKDNLSLKPVSSTQLSSTSKLTSENNLSKSSTSTTSTSTTSTTSTLTPTTSASRPTPVSTSTIASSAMARLRRENDSVQPSQQHPPALTPTTPHLSRPAIQPPSTTVTATPVRSFIPQVPDTSENTHRSTNRGPYSASGSYSSEHAVSRSATGLQFGSTSYSSEHSVPRPAAGMQFGTSHDGRQRERDTNNSASSLTPANRFNDPRNGISDDRRDRGSREPRENTRGGRGGRGGSRHQ